MEDLLQLAISFFTGAISGFLASVPVGPINVTIVNDGARHGFLRAWLVGLGAALMEMIYAAISLAGFANLFDSQLARSTMELASFMMLTFLGIRYFRAASLEKSTPSEKRIEQRLHPTTAFMVGFVRVLGNPGVLLLWITLSATFVAHEWVDPNPASKLACIAGVGTGNLFWFTLLSYGVSRRHGRLSREGLLRIQHVSGALMLAGATLVATRIIRLLAHH